MAVRLVLIISTAAYTLDMYLVLVCSGLLCRAVCALLWSTLHHSTRLHSGPVTQQHILLTLPYLTSSYKPAALGPVKHFILHVS